MELGETSCPNRIARLTRLAGIHAEIGYKRKPGSYGGRPSVVVSKTLDQKFDVAAPGSVGSILLAPFTFFSIKNTLFVQSMCETRQHQRRWKALR